VVGDWLQLDFTKTNGTHVTVSGHQHHGGTTIATLTQSLVNSVNANPVLQSADGVLASDFGDATYCGIIAAQLTLYARSPGWPASQIQVVFTASTNLLVLPAGTNRLQDNLTDLRPRNSSLRQLRGGLTHGEPRARHDSHPRRVPCLDRRRL